MLYGSAVGVLIEKNDRSEVYAREIYDEDNDFYYYLDMNGKWEQ